MTIEMLTQLELLLDGSFHSNLNPKTLSAPNLSAMDFPVHSSPEGQSVISRQQAFLFNCLKRITYFSLSRALQRHFEDIDFALAVKKAPVPESSIWKYERNGSANATIGSSRSSQILAGAYNNGIGRVSYGDRVSNCTSAHAAPAWLETGDAVANLYSELQEKARDHARLRNAYFEQARQAYLVGNKALAKELSVKGQLHGMHMKAAHGKAQESIYRLRNPVPLELQVDGRGKERMIDLHGLQFNEAIHVQKSELNVLRAPASKRRN